MLKSAQTSTKEKKPRYVKNQKDGTKMIEKMSNFKNSNKNKDLTVLADSLLALFMSVWGVSLTWEGDLKKTIRLRRA